MGRGARDVSSDEGEVLGGADCEDGARMDVRSFNFYGDLSMGRSGSPIKLAGDGGA